MSIKDLTPGEYRAKIVDWGLQTVQKINQPKVFIKLELEGGDQVKWEGFLKKIDGSANKKTTDTMKLCGFTGRKTVEFVASDALNKTKTFLVTIVKDGDYTRVEWINDPNAQPKVTDAKVINGFDLRSVDAEFADNIPVKREVKNHAPVMDPKDELPF